MPIPNQRALVQQVWFRNLLSWGAIAAWVVSIGISCVNAEDWPMRGRSGTRNSVSPEIGGPTDWTSGQGQDGQQNREARGVRWSVPLGSQTHSSPVISGGLVWIGTNNFQADSKAGGFQSVLKCFRVSDGKLMYEYVSPQLGPRIHDPGWTGLGSSPLVEGDRLWVTTNRSEVLCLDIGPLQRGEGPPREVWRLDLIKTFDIFAHVPLMGPPCPCSIGPSYQGRIFVTLNNGVDDSHTKVPKPDAPSLVCLNKETGEVHWTDNSPGANVLSTQFASPTVADINGQVQVIVPQGDGWVRAFDPVSGKRLWEFDINPKTSVHRLGGRFTRNSLLGSAVVYENRVFIASGVDAERGEGVGRLVCIDPSRTGDVSSELAVDADNKPLPKRRVQAVIPEAGEKAIPNPNSALVWETSADKKKFEETMHGTMASVAVSKGLVIAVDRAGLVHCFDAKTGRQYWVHDTFGAAWTTPLIVGDRVYVTNEDGNVYIYGLSPDPAVAMRQTGTSEPLHENAMGQPIYSSPTFANGVLYVATRNEFFAIAARPGDVDTTTGGFWPQWRGPSRDNVSTDTGLLQTWPEGGPPLVWRVQGLGDGVAPVSIAGGRIFSLSVYDTTEYVRALNEVTGEPIWSAVLGPNQQQNRLMRWLTQRSVTVDGERVYGMTLLGELVCLQTRDGRELWRRNYVTDFGGRRGGIGYADCPLVDGENLICTPGGPEASVVALNRKTGAVVWKCATPDLGRATYSNGMLATIDGQRQFVVALEKGLVGISADDGKLQWRHDGSAAFNYTHTPFVRDRFITSVHNDTGFRLLEVTRANDVCTVNLVTSSARIAVSRLQDDALLFGDRIYDCSFGVLSCTDAKTGTQIWANRFLKNAAAMSHADGRLYLHDTEGRVMLVEAGPDGPVDRGGFTLPDHVSSLGTTRPIITGNRLYVREDDQLFCYDIRKSAPDRKAEPTSIRLPLPMPAVGGKEADAEKTRTLRSVFVATPQDVVEKMLELAEIKKTDLVYDLGSGDGRIVMTAATKYGARAVGYELDKELAESSRARATESKLAELVSIENKDLFSADLTKADVVAVYLLPAQLEKLLPQLKAMKAGSRLVSHQFQIPGIAPDKTIQVESADDGHRHAVHLYKLPLRQQVP